MDLKDKTSQQTGFVRHDLTFRLPDIKKYLSLGFGGAAPYSYVRINLPLSNPPWMSSSFITPSGANANDQ